MNHERKTENRGYKMYPELLKLMGCKRMKHKELAKIIGVSQQATSKKIRGETEFRRSEMQKIRDYFKEYYPTITMDQIFTNDIFLP
jgi:predicted transcriptional regulator